MNPVMGKYGVYRVFDDSGTLIYVGASRDFKLRMHSHAASKPWRSEIHEPSTTVEWFDSIQDASSRESEVIATESPRYNTRGRSEQTSNKYAPRREYISPTRGMSNDDALAYWRGLNPGEPLP